LVTICIGEARKLRPTRMSTSSMPRIPAATESATGKKQDSAPIAILDPMPTPNHMIMMGKKMILGVGPR
jgi:hypothetical protein